MAFIKKHKWVLAGFAAAITVIVVVCLFALPRKTEQTGLDTSDTSSSEAVSALTSSTDASSLAAETSEPAVSSDPVSNESVSSTVASTEPVPISSTEPVHVHEFVEANTVAPTCTNKGYTVYKCACGATEKRDWTNTTVHVWGEWSKFDFYGKVQHVCSICGTSEENPVNREEKIDSDLDATDFRKLPAIPAECRNFAEYQIFSFYHSDGLAHYLRIIDYRTWGERPTVKHVGFMHLTCEWVDKDGNKQFQDIVFSDDDWNIYNDNYFCLEDDGTWYYQKSTSGVNAG